MALNNNWLIKMCNAWAKPTWEEVLYMLRECSPWQCWTRSQAFKKVSVQFAQLSGDGSRSKAATTNKNTEDKILSKNRLHISGQPIQEKTSGLLGISLEKKFLVSGSK